MTDDFPDTWCKALRSAARENGVTLTSTPPMKVSAFTAHAMIAQGGQAFVHLATGDTAGRSVPVVLKMFKHTSDGYRERVDRSVRLQVRVNEGRVGKLLPAVVAYDLDDGMPWVAQQYRGANLVTAMRAGLEFTDSLVIELVDAVWRLHLAGVTHRDLKPSNVLWRRSRLGREEVTLCDLDLARSDSLETLTRTGEYMGTPVYMAPEQALGLRVTQAADVFSLAATLVTLATGVPPDYAVTGLSDPRRSPVLDENSANKLGSKAEWVRQALSFDPGGRPPLEDLFDALTPRGPRQKILLSRRQSRNTGSDDQPSTTPFQ